MRFEHQAALLAALSLGCFGCAETATSGGGGTSGAGGQRAEDAVCSKFQDIPAASSVTLTVVNGRTTPVYLDTECLVPFTMLVAGAEHQAVQSDHFGGVQTCGSLQQEHRACCDCQPDSRFPLAPGESRDLAWHGLLYDTVRMPAACWDEASDAQYLDDKCYQPVAAAPGAMTVRVSVYQHVVDDGATGLIHAEQDFMYGTDNAVQIVVH